MLKDHKKQTFYKRKRKGKKGKIVMNFYLTSSAKGPLLITHSLTYSFISFSKYMPRLLKIESIYHLKTASPKIFSKAYFPQDANGKKKKVS